VDFLDDFERDESPAHRISDEDRCECEPQRECFIVWRGGQFTEVLFMDGGELKAKKPFTAPHDEDALRQALNEGVAWVAERRTSPAPVQPR